MYMGNVWYIRKCEGLKSDRRDVEKLGTII
jgi:hypothetical protein